MTREQLLAVAGTFRSLEEVTRWTFAGGHALVEIVTQDEYTHDVIVEAAASSSISSAASPAAGGAIYLVFDTT
jgi:hypothetical protein